MPVTTTPPSTSRKAIRAQLVAILKAANLVGTRVYPNRFDAWEESAELPAIGVYTLEETARILDEAPREYEREVAVVVEVVLEEGDTDLTGDEALGGLVRSVIDVLVHAEGANGTAARSWYQGYQIGETSSGARDLFCAKVRFVYRYYYEVDAGPATPDDLEEIDADWNVLGSPDVAAHDTVADMDA